MERNRIYRIITVKLSFQAIKKAVQGRSIGRPIRASARIESKYQKRNETLRRCAGRRIDFRDGSSTREFGRGEEEGKRKGKEKTGKMVSRITSIGERIIWGPFSLAWIDVYALYHRVSADNEHYVLITAIIVGSRARHIASPQ